MEIHAGKQGTAERVPTVRLLARLSGIPNSQTNDGHSLTQATDTSNIRLVFAAVKETILQNALKDSGIL